MMQHCTPKCKNIPYIPLNSQKKIIFYQINHSFVDKEMYHLGVRNLRNDFSTQCISQYEIYFPVSIMLIGSFCRRLVVVFLPVGSDDHSPVLYTRGTLQQHLEAAPWWYVGPSGVVGDRSPRGLHRHSLVSDN